MEALIQKIKAEGYVVGNDIIKVDSFLNHQLDVEFLNEIGKEFFEFFGDQKVTKILTCEASGIAIAIIAAQYFKVPVIFAKKVPSKNLDEATYAGSVYSYTRQVTYQIRVSKRYLSCEDRVLILDDFLANGQAVLGMKEIIDQAQATLLGVGIVIEKGFQPGGQLIRDAHIPLKSLAIVDRIANGEVVFRTQEKAPV